MGVLSRREQVIRRDRSICQYCGRVCVAHRGLFAVVPPDMLTIDHVIPLVRGGLRKLANECVACVVCNAAKGAMTGDEYRAWLRETVRLINGRYHADDVAS